MSHFLCNPTRRPGTPIARLLAVLTVAVFAAGPVCAAFVGVTSVRAQWFQNQTIPFYPVDEGEHFGAALAAGDFNADGAMDLATGIPQDTGSTVDPQFETGAVIVRWGIPGHGLATGLADTILNAYAEGSQITPQQSGQFGAALAVGDFNGDGFDDLAVGAPQTFADPDCCNEGAVLIHYGLPTGIQIAAEHLLLPGTNGVPDPPDGLERFGSALAAGDFDGDGHDDLAMGAPQLGGLGSGGAVIVVHGHFGGVYPFAGYMLRQGVDGLPGTAEVGDFFGTALAAGNFNGDVRCTDACRPLDDLAIGSPGESGGQGVVVTVFGSELGGLIFTLSNYLQQGDLGGVGEADDQFGRVLAAGDFDGDGSDELVVGTPYEDLVNAEAGELTVIRGLSAVSPYFMSAVRHTQGSIFGSPTYDQANDRFGAALAIADFDRDGYDDLAIGVPGEDAGGVNRGGVTVLTGAVGGLYSRFRFLPAGVAGIPPAIENSSDMGAALATGDFDGDGHADLAIGLPYRNTTPVLVDTGAETVLYGSMFSDGFEAGFIVDWSVWVP